MEIVPENTRRKHSAPTGLGPKGTHPSSPGPTSLPSFLAFLQLPSHSPLTEDKGGNGIPIKGQGHMAKRSGPLGPCFPEVVRPPRQPGSSPGARVWGVLPLASSYVKCQTAGGQPEQSRPSGPHLGHVCAHTSWGRGQQRNPCLCPQSGSQPSCDHLLSS